MPSPDLPEGYTARPPGPDDLDALVRLVDARRALTPGRGRVDPDLVTARWSGWGRGRAASSSSRPPSATSSRGRACTTGPPAAATCGSWSTRPAPTATPSPQSLFAWTEAVAVTIAAERDVAETRLELLLDSGDQPLKDWAAAAGHR